MFETVKIERVKPRTFHITPSSNSTFWNYWDQVGDVKKAATEVKKWCKQNKLEFNIRMTYGFREDMFTVTFRKNADVIAFMLKWC